MLELGQNIAPHSPSVATKINTHQFHPHLAANMTERGAGEKEKQTCWKLLSLSEKILLFLLILTILILILLFLFIVIFFLNINNTCNSPSCIKAAAHLLNTIDFAEDPCTDFEKFVCGNQIAALRESDSAVTLRKAALVSEEILPGDSKSMTMVKKFYQACSNSSAIEDDGDATLLSVIRDIGGWPLLLGQNWQEMNYSWLSFMVKLRRRGIKSDWIIGLDSVEMADGTHVLTIGAPPDVKPVPNELKLIYYETMVNVAEKLGSSVEFAWKEMQKVANFEYELAAICEKARNRSGNDYRETNVRVTVRKLYDIWHGIDVVKTLNHLAGFTIFNNNTIVIVTVQNYLYDLEQLLSATAARTQANYFIWKILETFLPYSSDGLREKYEAYSQIGSREDFCFTETSKRFYGAIETAYLGKYLNEEIHDSLKEMTNLIKSQIIDGDFEHPSDVVIMDLEDNNSGIVDLEFSSDNIIQMVKEIHLQVENGFYSCLHRNSTNCRKKTYHEDSGSSETYFDVSQNRLYLPSKVLQSDWYDWDRPTYLNYGRIGRTIGNVIIEALRQVNVSLNEDLNGADLAYLGYLQWAQENGMEKKLVGLNFTIKQLFWVYSSSIYCTITNSSNHFNDVQHSTNFITEFNCQSI